MKRKRKFSPCRLVVILTFGVLGLLGVNAFSQYVKSISDLPVGPTPLSWTFKSNTRLVSQTFNQGEIQVLDKMSPALAIPEIDRVDYSVTETALFALG